MEAALIASMYAVVTDPAFYAGIVVGVCGLLSLIIVSARVSHNAGWRYTKSE